MDTSQHHQAGAELDPGPAAHLRPALPSLRLPRWRGGRPGPHFGKHCASSELLACPPAHAQLQEERRGHLRKSLHLLACGVDLHGNHLQVLRRHLNCYRIGGLIFL